MTLPYSRKYDFERIERAETRESRWWERLHSAADVIDLYAARVRETPLDRDCPEFKLPPTTDVQDELKRMRIDLGVDSLGAMFGMSLTFELVELGDGLYDRPMDKGLYPPLASGSYQGLLTSKPRLHLGAASLKRMTIEALEELHANILGLVYPELDRDQLTEERRRLLSEAGRLKHESEATA